MMSERAHETTSSEVLALQTELTEMESMKVIVTAYVSSGFLSFFLHTFPCFCDNPHELVLRLNYFLD